MREVTYCALGIDLGGTNIKGAVVDAEGRVIVKEEISTKASEGFQGVAGRIIELCRRLADDAKILLHDFKGLGIGIPGLPDQSTGRVVFAPNLGWRDVPLLDLLKEHLDLPIFLENDANVAALGENWVGAGYGSNNMVMITIGTGIGAGIIINGMIYRGSNGSAGEVGHITVLEDGPLCKCGRKGCLETLTAAPAVMRMAREAIKNNPKTALAQLPDVNTKLVFEAAASGDEVALEIVEKMAHYLGIGLGNVINILNPDTILIGGGVSRAGDTLMEPLRKSALLYSLETPAAAVKIIPAALGNDAGVIGAAKLVW